MFQRKLSRWRTQYVGTTDCWRLDVDYLAIQLFPLSSPTVVLEVDEFASI
jgi:hypothetical protein